MKNRIYEEPKIETVAFSDADILTYSFGGGFDGEDDNLEEILIPRS